MTSEDDVQEFSQQYYCNSSKLETFQTPKGRRQNTLLYSCSVPTLEALCWSSREDIPHIQGKRNPSKMVGVAREHQRADTLKPYSQKTSQSNHTRTTALSNSMKLSHARGATQDGQVMVERSDRMWSTGEGNGKPLQPGVTLV